MTEYIILLLTGFTAGIIGTIIGAGGGFLVVPYLLLVQKYSPQLAVGTSLTMVFFNALSGTYAYAKLKRIDYSTAWKFALATIPGSIVGAFTAHFWEGQTFRLIFGLFIALVALQILYRSFTKRETAAAQDGNSKSQTTKTITDSFGNTYTINYNLWLGIISSFGVGFLASILGIGGGLIHVPLLIYALGFPAHIATATSHLILTISSLIGSASHYYLGNVQIKTALFLSLGAIVGAQLGAKLSYRLKEDLIIRLLALALIFLAFRLLFG